jgi:hypothetical protein
MTKFYGLFSPCGGNELDLSILRWFVRLCQPQNQSTLESHSECMVALKLLKIITYEFLEALLYMQENTGSIPTHNRSTLLRIKDNY